MSKQAVFLGSHCFVWYIIVCMHVHTYGRLLPWPSDYSGWLANNYVSPLNCGAGSLTLVGSLGIKKKWYRSHRTHNTQIAQTTDQCVPTGQKSPATDARFAPRHFSACEPVVKFQQIVHTCNSRPSTFIPCPWTTTVYIWNYRKSETLPHELIPREKQMLKCDMLLETVWIHTRSVLYIPLDYN